jgi:uncharacterized protein involved in response to NO
VQNNSRTASASQPRWALWQLGFRPFYLLASGFAAISIALWAAQYGGWLPHSYLNGPVWHAHEMLYGFTLAVIAGFLFTAVRNWTNRPTPTGGSLMAIALLWLAGRVLILTPLAWLSAVVNAAFPIAVAIGIGVPLLRSGNRRNYFFIGLLTAIGIGSLYVHAALILSWPTPSWVGIRTGLDIVLLIMVVMAGRVVPMFTTNAIPGARSRRNVLVERASIAVVIALAIFDVLQIEGTALVALLLVAVLAHGARWWLWAPVKTLRNPLVWVLHAAYAWILIYFLLRATAVLQLTASALATHAFTVGAIGGLTIGMMTRTAKGHTGRPLLADRADTAAYVLIFAAAGLRVFGPMLWPDAYSWWVLVSAAFWSTGFGLYAVHYWNPLTRPRADGAPG